MAGGMEAHGDKLWMQTLQMTRERDPEADVPSWFAASKMPISSGPAIGGGIREAATSACF